MESGKSEAGNGRAERQENKKIKNKKCRPTVDMYLFQAIFFLPEGKWMDERRNEGCQGPSHQGETCSFALDTS